MTLHLISNVLNVRINALDDIILPKLDTAIFQIDEILEDMSQEEFIRMKKIKEHLEQIQAQERKA